MNAGGSILLLGTAAEFLDASGITSGTFSTTSYSTYPLYLRIEDTTHPVSEGWSSGQQLNINSTSYTYFGYTQTSWINPSVGIDTIGYYYQSSTYKVFGEDTSKNLIIEFDGNGVVRNHQVMSNVPRPQ